MTPTMNVRLATEADLDAMTWVLVGASPHDPVYPYRFPNLYGDEFAALCAQKCAEYLETSTVVVCEMPLEGHPTRTHVVAFSAWDCPQAPRTRLSAVEPSSRTSNHAVKPVTIGYRDRQNVFRQTCAASKRDLFDSRYPRGHVFLKILLCHPSYQRRGAGRALTEWGIDEARRRRLNTTVFASPMGFELYRKLGFREIGRFKVQLEGEDVFLEIPAMVLRPEAETTHDFGLEPLRHRQLHDNPIGRRIVGSRRETPHVVGHYPDTYPACTTIACT
ncbi:putative N-acetyltransferase ycf52-like protein [Podospora conica]|nr:putative N-acetyltransferase ycf52-like protein [Schizothecium conicum]